MFKSMFAAVAACSVLLLPGCQAEESESDEEHILPLDGSGEGSEDLGDEPSPEPASICRASCSWKTKTCICTGSLDCCLWTCNYKCNPE